MGVKSKRREMVVGTAHIENAVYLGGVKLTASGAEINILDGLTSTAAELSALHSQGAVAADFAKLHAVTSTAAELSALHSQGAVAADFAKLHAITASADEINKVDTLTAGAALVVAEMVSYTETANSGVYTGSVTVPAGALLLDIKTWTPVLWAAETSAQMIIGDVTDPNGWFDAIDLKATDLLVGEEINFVQTGGTEGAYLSTTTGKRSAAAPGAQRVITGEITTVDASGAGGAGRTYMAVIYVAPTAVAATKA